MTVRLLPLVLGTALVLAAPPASAGDLLLAKFEGDWVGRGKVRRNAESVPENIYCKITGKLTDSGLEQSGRCAVGNDSGSLSLVLNIDAGGGYTGTIKVPGRGLGSLAGAGSAAGLDLLASSPDAASGMPAEAIVRLRLMTTPGYVMSTTVKDSPAKPGFEVGSIVFTRE